MPMVYCYARSSTNEQEVTIFAQERRCRQEFDMRFAETHTWGGLFADQGVSGSKKFFQRDAGFRLNLELKQGDVVIFTKLDRGFRNVRDFLEVIELWEQKGVRLIMLDLNLDTGTPTGKMMAVVMAAFGEFERERCKERTKEVAAERKRLGLPVGRPPYGFRCNGPRGKRILQADPLQREFGRKVLDWSNQGWSLDRIYFWLIQERVKRPGGSDYSRATIHRAIVAERILQFIESQGIKPRPEHLLGT